MNEQVVKRLAVLLSVKSLVTLALTAVFAALTLRGGVGQEFHAGLHHGHRLLLRDPDPEDQRRRGGGAPMTALQPRTREAVLQIAAWQLGVLE